MIFIAKLEIQINYYQPADLIAIKKLVLARAICNNSGLSLLEIAFSRSFRLLVFFLF
jgi:hypothetical protein